MMMSTTPTSCVTVIPVYKAILNRTEALSLLQLRLLGIKNVTLACPNDLDLSQYFALWPELKIYRYSTEHFVSIQAYNDLVISSAFYEPFSRDYEYLLLYQLDAFLLSNQVDRFCKEGFDYYGAPWVTGFPQYHFFLNRWPIRLNPRRFYVGNGGLSLRKISSTIELLKRKAQHPSKHFFMEDAFFGYWGSIDPYFHACPPLIAAQFALETEPAYWLEKTGALPMGFHGFQVWNKDFYRPILQEAYLKLFKEFPVLENIKGNK